MKGKEWFRQIVLGYICAGHIATGLLLVSGKQGIRVAARLYGARFEPTGQFETIIRPAGAFVLSLGFLQAMALLEPRRYKAVIDATLLVMLFRQFQRIVFRREVYAAFGISPARHWAMTAYFATLAALLLLARLGLEDEAD